MVKRLLRRARRRFPVRVHPVRVTTPLPQIRACSEAAARAPAITPTPRTRACKVLVVEFRVPVPHVQAHRAPVLLGRERHVLALLVQADQAKAPVRVASASAQAAQARAAAQVSAPARREQVHVQEVHPAATLVPTVHPVAVVVVVPVVEPLVRSVAVVARARHASRSGRSGQSSNSEKLRRSVA